MQAFMVVGCVVVPILSMCLLGVATAGAQPTARAVRLVQEVTIRGAVGDDTEAALSSVSALAVRSDGVVMLAQPSDRVVRVFGPDGRFVRVVGRDGSGPGEFRSIDRLGWLGDSLVVYDRAQRRYTVFTPAGRVARIVPIASLVMGKQVDGSTQDEVGLFPNGRALVITQTMLAGERRFPTEVRVAARLRGGASEALLFEFAARVPRALLQFAGGITVPVQLPYIDTPLFGVAPNGNQIVLLERPTPSGPQGAFTIKRFSSSGKLMGTRTYEYAAERIGPREVDSLVAGRAEQMLPMINRNGQVTTLSALKVQIRSAAKIPAFAPAFATQLVVGDDGSVWVRLREADGRWLGIDSSGVLIGEVALPRYSAIAAATSRTIWAVGADADDLPVVTRYRLDRG
jgi:hypothetical protein